MGMDGVYIVMDVEDHFGIHIRDDEGQSVRTVGDLVAIIQNRIHVAHAEYCPSLRAFFQLRNSVREAAHNDSLRIRPGDRVSHMLNVEERRALWDALPTLLGSFPNGLRLPFAARLLAYLAFAISAYFIVKNLLMLGGEFWPLAMIALSLPILLLTAIFSRFRTSPPTGWATFGELTQHIVASTAATKLLGLQSEVEILAELRPIIAEALGIAPQTIELQSRFVEDLGVS
ncbi:MAG: acyl carrier protein [Aureliella sp.]